MTLKEHLPGGSQKWIPSHPEKIKRFLLFLLVRRAQKVLQEGSPPSFGNSRDSKEQHSETPKSQLPFVICTKIASARAPQIADTIRVLHREGLQKNTPDRRYYSCFASKRPPEEHPRSQILFVFCIGKTSKTTLMEHLLAGSQKWGPSHPAQELCGISM